MPPEARPTPRAGTGAVEETDERRCLGIVERAYRGALEKQFFDELYLSVEMHRQLGGLDLLLRGQAVCYAAASATVPELRFGKATVTTLSDHRRDLVTLLENGVRVLAEESSLAAYLPGGAARLTPGVVPVADGELAPRWPDYRLVFFI
ncbi:hypothetical protein SAMN06297387_106163 [Streptomyces zhaozhouensis]|uniref:Uncharacterized protein n=1 Tax=Streptomyces zhaozhouensis TaxID=1300267 RepID=A0A286DVB4_9ACTN|nr:hypothetical protein [Streptomyces zhaozhouensis]SOD62586.1 hypothetical protein SAMN06297387_106163 [Streptomyces zhaozhouensis]